ncbi:Oxygen evolving enhancer protein 3 (PsbQ) [Musa troglodytarum]|uniref:Oxygen evolving enhancer protein 3 (PsbQ) n=1 Tax=Musa troglodytarum TaxID=320322 RepID=A0A9E7FQK1_9LILI|nr:Oxygen evolving enhancer protein 3 (PsbQ) [Musa troglodytarum]
MAFCLQIWCVNEIATHWLQLSGEEQEHQRKEGMESKGCAHRIKNCGSELLALEGHLTNVNEGKWKLMENSLRLKSTFLYCDLNRLISNEKDELQELLTDLTNRLTRYLEKLDRAVKTRSVPLARIHYNDVANVLREIGAALTPLL